MSEENKRVAYGLALVWTVIALLGFNLVYAIFAEAQGILSGVDGINMVAVSSSILGILGIFLGTYVLRRLSTRKNYVVEINDSNFLPQDPNKELPEGIRIRNEEYVQQYVDDYFRDLTTSVYRQALVIADRDGGRDEILTRDVAQACSDIAPGNPFPVQQTLTQRLSSSITGITVISAVLAFIFGFIGFAGLRWGGNQGAETVQAFVDIAQIFAGAVVGSTGAVAISGR